MNMLKQLNEAINYIEEHLRGEIDFAEAARRACVSEDGFTRFFCYMTGISLNEYVRRRRMTLAVEDLRLEKSRVLDIAVRYGYDSAAGFSRAFAKQHGVAPAVYRKNGGPVKLFPPASFHMIVKGAKEIVCDIFEFTGMKVYGISRQLDGQRYQTRDELHHSMWAADEENIGGRISSGTWNAPGKSHYDGVWYGIWQDDSYMVAREKENVEYGGLEERIIPAGTYAAFQWKRGVTARKSYAQMMELAFDCWLPSSGYRQKSDMTIEVGHIWTDREVRKKNRYFELWIPVERR